FQLLQSFENQNVSGALRRLGSTQNIFKIPAVASRDRTSCQQTDESIVFVSRCKHSFPIRIQKRIESQQPAEGCCRTPRAEPLEAEVSSFLPQLAIEAFNYHHAHSCSLRSIHTRAQLLGTIPARLPTLQIKIRSRPDPDSA